MVPEKVLTYEQAEIDQMTGGLQPANLVIIAGRPSMGKTSLAMNMASHVAMIEKKSVAFFSLEMSRNDLLMRLVGTAAGVDGNKIRSGNLEDEDWEHIYDATELLNNSKLYIDDTTQIGVTEIRSKCRRINLLHDGGIRCDGRAHGKDVDRTEYLEHRDHTDNNQIERGGRDQRYRDLHKLGKGTGTIDSSRFIKCFRYIFDSSHIDNQNITK